MNPIDVIAARLPARRRVPQGARGRVGRAFTPFQSFDPAIALFCNTFHCSVASTRSLCAHTRVRPTGLPVDNISRWLGDDTNCLLELSRASILVDARGTRRETGDAIETRSKTSSRACPSSFVEEGARVALIIVG